MGRKLDLSKLTDEEAKHVWEVVQRDFDLRKKEEERLEIVQTGSLEWFHEHVRSRFKRFGSAKVMRSLHGRMTHGQKVNPTLLGMGRGLGLHDRVYSLPDINSEYQLWDKDDDSEEEETNDVMDSAEAECYTRTFAEFPGAEQDPSQRDSTLAEADLAATFHPALQEQGQQMSPPEQEFSPEVLLTTNSHAKHLGGKPKAGILWKEQHRSPYSADMDTSDEDMKGAQKLLAYQPHHTKRRSRASSQENINLSGNQPLAPVLQTDPTIEEKELKRKLEELASNISDKAVSSDEEGGGKKEEASKPDLSLSSDDLPTGAKQADGLEEKVGDQDDHARHSGNTDSELSELEDKVASAAAQVQHTESEVSDIESRIAALSAAGLTVKPVEKSKKKNSSAQMFILQQPKNAQDSLEDQCSDSLVTESPEDFKVMSMPHLLRRKFTTSLEIASNDESFVRNSYYTGSLTQRNPNGRNKKADRIFAKPVMTHWS